MMVALVWRVYAPDRPQFEAKVHCALPQVNLYARAPPRGPSKFDLHIPPGRTSVFLFPAQRAPRPGPTNTYEKFGPAGPAVELRLAGHD